MSNLINLLKARLQELELLRSNSAQATDAIDDQIGQLEGQIFKLRSKRKLKKFRKFVGKVCVIHIKVYGGSGTYVLGTVHDLDTDYDDWTDEIRVKVKTDPIYLVKDNKEDDWKVKPLWDNWCSDGWHWDVDRIEEAYEW